MDGSKQIIGWLELAMSRKSQDAIATLHPIDLDEHQPCCRVTVDKRWLCGSDGNLTCFDSMMAARQFLHLLNVDRVAKGERYDCEVSEKDAFQCFYLAGQNLSPCNKCHTAGDVGACISKAAPGQRSSG